MTDEEPKSHSHARSEVPAAQALVLGGGESLQVRWGTASFKLTAETLRAACRCAFCRRAQIDGRFPADFEGLTIAWQNPVGHYGVNLGFSDGHDRGIYPWSYLAELVATPSGNSPVTQD